MAKITVMVDNILYSKERIKNNPIELVDRIIEEHEEHKKIHAQLVASGIFDKEFLV